MGKGVVDDTAYVTVHTKTNHMSGKIFLSLQWFSTVQYFSVANFKLIGIIRAEI